MISESSNLEFRVIELNEWRKKTLPLSPWNREHEWIPIFSNPLGINQYMGKEVFEKTLLFPVAAHIDGVSVAWALTYSLSDVLIRIRGLYVNPRFRGQGVGPKLCDFALSLWPKPWHRCVGYWRSDSFQIMEKHWGLQPMPGFIPRSRFVSPATVATDHQIVFAYKDF